MRVLLDILDIRGPQPCTKCLHYRVEEGAPFRPSRECGRVVGIFGTSSDCAEARSEEGPCGPGGKLFQPKENP